MTCADKDDGDFDIVVETGIDCNHKMAAGERAIHRVLIRNRGPLAGKVRLDFYWDGDPLAYTDGQSWSKTYDIPGRDRRTRQPCELTVSKVIVNKAESAFGLKQATLRFFCMAEENMNPEYAGSLPLTIDCI